MFHEENCKNIFYILMDSFLGKITKAGARKKLETCDLSNPTSFDAGIQKQIRDIMQ